MKGLILVCLFFALVLSQDPWVKVWGDEFEGNSLNLFNWAPEVNCWGGGNNELQCYTQKDDNIKVTGGNLLLTAVYVPGGYQGSTDDCTLNTQNSCFWTRDFRSGRVRSKANNINSWKYGRIEMRAKLPNGKHLWPAFWMMPSDDVYGTWAASGEIDIMEYRGQKTTMNEGTLHFGAPWPNNVHDGSGPKDMGVDLSADFHIFAVEWEQDQIKWFVDQNNFHTMNLNTNFSRGPFAYAQNRSPFDQRFHILLNLAVGGGFFNDQTLYGTFTPEESRQWANPTYTIDYVRVLQRQSTIKTPDCGSAIQFSGGATKESETEVKESSTMTLSIGIIATIVALLFQ